MRPFFIGLSIALGFSINPAVMAQSADQNIQHLISSFQLGKGHIAELIRSLTMQGKITSVEADTAMAKLELITTEELQSLTMDSIGNVHRVSEQIPLLAYNEENSQKVVIDKILSKRSPASLSDANELRSEDERERKKLEEAQLRLLRTGFDIKKYQ
jgi:glyoxylate carboligase